MTNYARLLGAPRVRVAETWHDLPPTKATALLVYLAYAGDWVSRDELLYLFYPDSAETPARGSLRQLLRRLPYTQGLESEDTHVRWQLDTDVAAFKRAIAQEKWAKALELYRGELLHGFQPHDLSEFDNWLSLERQTLHSSWRKASLTFASELMANERSSLAAEVLALVHKAEPFDEEVLRVYLEGLYVSGQKGQALEIFTAFNNTLRHELSSEPEPSTLELVTLIHGDKPLSVKSAVTTKTQVKPRTKEAKPRHNLPTQPTEFVGREAEKAKLKALLAEPRCRLVSIVAPGGMGKTRLALEVARIQIDHFEQGVWFASFVAVNAPEPMVYTVADALDLSFFGQREPKEQLFDYLADKELLLILDNLEHLLSGVGLIRELLEAAPKLKVLATSRERLNLQAEHVFDLGGLAVPDEQSSDAKDFDSLQLFAQSAEHSRHDFVLDDSTIPSVTQICKLVEGMPLAIELAASWLRALSITDIAHEIEKGISVLESSARDLPARHQSIRAVFDHSWKLLTETEQIALRRLSVFQGGFRREAALEIAGVSLPVLARLVDKSFLSPTPNGRYRRHPLVIQYTREKLSEHPDEQVEIQYKHGSYYHNFLNEWGERLRGARVRQAVNAIEEELENVRLAWKWAVEAQYTSELQRNAKALNDFFQLKGFFREALDLLRQAEQKLDASNVSHHAALGYIFIAQSGLYFLLGHREKLGELSQQALDLLRPLGEPWGVTQALLDLGSACKGVGDFKKSKDYLYEALALAKQNHLDDLVVAALARLATAEESMGNYQAAEQHIREAIKIPQSLGIPPHPVQSLGVLASIVRHSKGPKAALPVLFEALQSAKDHGFDSAQVTVTCELSATFIELGDYSKATALAAPAIHMAEELGLPFETGILLVCLARASIGLEKYPQAEAYLKQCLELSQAQKSKLSSVKIALIALLGFVELRIKEGQLELSARYLSVVLSRSNLLQSLDAILAKDMLEMLANQLASQELQEALERGKTLDLTAVAQGILAGP